MKNNFKVSVSTMLILIVSVVCVGLLSGCTETTKEGGQSNTKYNYTGDNTTEAAPAKKDEYGFNETFMFDGLEITIGDGYTFTTVKNQFSDLNGKPVIKLPVTLKNTTSETKGLNMFYYKTYGSQGTAVDTADAYFDSKTSLTYGGDLRSGAGKTAYLYVVYDGDGLYAIEFNNYSEKVTAEFNIKK